MQHAFNLDRATIMRTVIKGTPVQWARARGGGGDPSGNGGGGSRQKSYFTAPAQARYKSLCKDEGNLAMLQARARREHNGKPVPLGVPVIFEALVFLPIPPSFTKAEELAARTGMLRPTGKPDLDNWMKLPMDALEGIVYANDSQVVGFGDSGIWYAEKPRLELHIYHAPLGPPTDWSAIDEAILNLRTLVSANTPKASAYTLAMLAAVNGGKPVTPVDLIDHIRTMLGLAIVRPSTETELL